MATTQELIRIYNSYRSAIEKGETLPPLMIFAGAEAFFVNLFEELLTHHYAKEQVEELNRQIYFGPEISVDTILGDAQSYSMFGGKRIILVREATQVKPSNGKNKKITIEDLPDFTSHFAPETSVALFYRGKDAPAKLRKAAKEAHCLLVESPLITKDADIKQAIDAIAAKHQLKLVPAARTLLKELVGNDLTTMNSQMEKLVIPAAKNNHTVTTEMISDLVGMSREYSPFELLNAIQQGNQPKAYQLALFMANNDKSYPLPMLISMLYNFFSNLLVYHFHKRQPIDQQIQILKLRNAYQLRNFSTASRFYNGIRTMNIISALRLADAEYKGARGSSLPPQAILKDLLTAIFL